MIMAQNNTQVIRATRNRATVELTSLRPGLYHHAMVRRAAHFLRLIPVLLCLAAGAVEPATPARAQSSPSNPVPRTWVVAPDGTGQFRSIQDAIDGAGPGDTIEIRAGDYAEDVTIHSKERIKLVGEGRDRVNVLGRNRVGAFHIGKWPYGATDVVISGITIHQHGGLALGIFNGQSIVLRQVTVHGLVFGQQVRKVRIEDCEMGGSETTGIQFADSDAVLIGNVIHDNDHGVTIAGKSTVRLERNVVTRNLFEGIVVTDSAQASLLSNTIAKNGGGAAFLGRSRSEVHGNIVGFNKVGFLIAPTSQTTFSYNALYNSEQDYRVTGPSESAGQEGRPVSDIRVDPGFMDPGRDDFRLRGDTPLLHLGGFPYLGALAPAATP
jgi:parallel beta-helix repeat protein